jgi:hypothetical protein
MTDDITQVGEAFVRTDLGDDLPAITHHRESEHVGGAHYRRCEGCGAEALDDAEGCPRRRSWR